MGYIIRKSKNTFRIQFEYNQGGKRTARKLTLQELMDLGLAGRPLEEAKARIALINKSEAHKKVKASREKIAIRVAGGQHYAPDWLVEEFEREELSVKHGQRNVQTLWRAALASIHQVKQTPEKWSSGQFYSYFEKQRWAPSYVKKVIHYLNLWGAHWQRKQNRLVGKIKQPSMHARERIQDEADKARRAPKDSLGLFPEDLIALKIQLPVMQWRWIFITFWLGLRPNETRLSTDTKKVPYITIEGDMEVAHLWQWKVRSYKKVPLLYPEQKQAYAWLIEGGLQKVWPKRLQALTGRRTHTYAGRKGFAPEMWRRGHDYVEVASWMGHKDIKTTYADYMKWMELKRRKVG